MKLPHPPIRRPAVLAFAASAVLAALALASTPVAPLWSTIDGGGARSTGGTVTLTGTIGQPDAGTMTRANWVLRGGYWVGGETATAVVGPGDPALPPPFHLHAAHPNPFNPVTKIRFDLPSTARVSLRIYNLRGELVTTLVDDELPSGSHSVVWHGTDRRGAAVASGVYLLALDAGSHHARQKLGLVR